MASMRNSRNWAFAIAVFMYMAGTVQAVTITVGPGGPGGGYDYATIQDGINAAVNGDEVVIAEGTYTGAGNYNISFGGRAITVRSTDPCDPAVVAATIIDCNGSSSNERRGFNFGSGEGADSVLAGLTITNGYAYGGGINCWNSSSPIIKYCWITGNYGRSDSGGGIICRSGASPIITHCTISNNTAQYLGGGVHWYYGGVGGSPTLSHSTITNNSAGWEGGGICTFSRCNGVVSHCILWGNSAGTGSQISVIADYAPSTLSVSYSDVQGGQAGVYVEDNCILNWGAGNIDADPCFVYPGGGDYHLSKDSSCINSGDPTYTPLPGETDIDGEPRVIDGCIDIGADEFNITGPVLGINPGEFYFSSYYNGPDPESQILSIRNAGYDTLMWEVIEDCFWLEANPTNGESTGEIDNVSLNIDISGLEPGNYDCNLTVSDPCASNNPQSVDIHLFIEALPIIELDAIEFNFAANGGGINPDNQTLGIRNIGEMTLNWEIIHDCNWLEVIPTSGSSTGETDEVTLAVDITGLPGGEYDCELMITDPCAVNSPQTVAVNLYLTPFVEKDLYVDKDAEGGNDGSSWANAYEHLQDALEAAENGNIILVAEGTYTPDSNSAIPAGSGDRGATFELISGVTIQGGYAGYGEPDPNARDVELYETILSGDLDDNDGEATDAEDLLDDPNRSENSYHVVTSSGTDMTAVLDGLSIKGGHANGPDPNEDRGGGLYNEDGSPTIINCTISDNSARAKDGNGLDRINGDRGYGGGFYINGGSPTLTGCTFLGNAIRGGDNSGSGSGDGNGGHSYGGGMYSINANFVLVNCTFSNNLVLGGNGNTYVVCKGGNGYGSGLYHADGTITLTNSTFIDNLAKGGETGDNTSCGYGAGLYNKSVLSGSTIVNCTFRNNRSSRGSGGGIYFNWSSPTLSNCVFIDNTGGSGGGICCSNSKPTISDSDFLNNRAYVGNGKGGGMYNASHSHAKLNSCNFIGNSAGYGGGMYNDNSDPSLTNCEFIQNTATFSSGGGGGMYNDGGNSTLTNCLFVENSATSGSGSGGGMCNYYSEPTLTGCTLINNSSGKYGGGISILEVSHPMLSNCILWGNSAPIGAGIYDEEFYTWITIEYSDVQGGCSWSCSTNINTDPLFATGLLGDYYLSQTSAGQASTSPCVDSGGGTAANLGLDEFTTRTDHAGDEGVVDMGYHYPMTGDPDIVKDGCVNFIDYAILASQWLDEPGTPSADIAPFSGDGIVDTNDLGLLVDFWLNYYISAAESPMPVNNEIDVDPDIVLSWSPGEFASSHDVYLGTDFDEVNNASVLSDKYKGDLDVTSYDPCWLEPGTVYFWRVDEKNTCGSVKGYVWSFRTMEVSEFMASKPKPCDTAQAVDPYTSLSWTAGYGALSHDVYFGTGFDDVNDATVESSEYMDNFDVNSYDPCGLELGMDYFWRIDEENATYGIMKGEVWSFTTMEMLDFKAINPDPADGTLGVDPNITLIWTTMYEVLSHDVYFGTDFNDVNDANIYSDAYMGNFDVPSYDPCGLDIETTYYWRIDEENVLGTAKGDVWSFTTWALNPVAWWEFEEGKGGTAYDSSGKGKDGILNGDPNWVVGKVGEYALDFDGDGDYVSIPSISALGGSNITITAWINGDNFDGFCPVLTQYNSSYKGYYLYVRGSSDKPALFLSGVEVVSTSAISTGQWYHIAGTYDNNTLKIYINGDLKNTFLAIGGNGVEHNCYIGYDQTDGFYFDGRIDDVRVYNRALSAGEIWALYQAGL